MATATKQGGIVRGGEETSHANDGVKYVVKTTGQHVELEGDEIVLCENLMKSDKFFTFTDTPLNIIKTLADEYGCKRGTLTEIQGGEFVICKKVVRDDTPITVSGTPPDIISQLQMEKGCNVHWSWDLKKHDKATCKSCEEHKEMEDGGIVKGGLGDCFVVAAKAMQDYWYDTGRKYYGEPYLVHAEVTGTGKLAGIKFAHAFIEDDHLVYDFSNGLNVITAKQLYYQLGNIKTDNPKKYQRYDADETMDKLLENDTYGSWDLDVPNPTLETETIFPDIRGKSFEANNIHIIKGGAYYCGMPITALKQTDTHLSKSYYSVESLGTHLGTIALNEEDVKAIEGFLATVNSDAKFESGGVVYGVSVPDYMGVIRLEDGGELAGLAHGMINDDIAKKHNVPVEQINEQMLKGIEVELEHTGNRQLAEIIARDHLFEIVDYYDRLEKMEAEAESEAEVPEEQPATDKRSVSRDYGLTNPQTVDDVVSNLFILLEQKRSRKWGAYFAEEYLNEIDKDVAQRFLNKYGIVNRADLKVYTEKLQHKARTGKGLERQQLLKEIRDEAAEYSVARIIGAVREHEAEYENGGVIASDSKLTYFYEPDTMMPMDSTFQNGALYQTSMAMFKEGGVISKSSTGTLSLIRELRSKELDERYRKFVRDSYVSELNTVEGYLLGNIKVLSRVEQDSVGFFSVNNSSGEAFISQYASVILDDADDIMGRRNMLMFKKGLEHMPVPNGFWTDYWDSKKLKLAKVSSSRFNNMDLSERATLENKLQLSKIKDTFWYSFAEFYLADEHSKWWFGGGSRMSLEAGCAYWADRLTKEYAIKKMATGGAVADKPTEKEIEERWEKKKDHIMQLATSLRSLRYNLTADMKSDDEKDRLTALAIAVMDKTGERVGNDESADEGHSGITGLKKKNIKISGNKVSLDYTGKCGVEQEKSFSDELIAKKLKEAMEKTPDSFVFTTTDGFKIKNDRVNRYLSEYGVSAKDMRGFFANKHIQKKLEREPASKDEKEREKQFREAVKYAATKVGHGAATLKSHYLIPELEKAFILKGEIINLADFYKTGGLVKMANGGHVEISGQAGMPSRHWERSAAGVLLVAYDTGRCLFLKRGALLPEGEKWALLSGGIEGDETPKQAIMREMKEEVGHTEDVCFKLSYIHNSKTDDFGFYNFIGVVAREFVPKLNFENSEYAWVDYRNLPTPLHFGVAEFLQNVNLRHELIYALELYMYLNPHGIS